MQAREGPGMSKQMPRGRKGNELEGNLGEKRNQYRKVA